MKENTNQIECIEYNEEDEKKRKKLFVSRTIYSGSEK